MKLSKSRLLNARLINLSRAFLRLDKIVELFNPSASGVASLRSTHGPHTGPHTGSTAELSIAVALVGDGWGKNGSGGNNGLHESKIS